MSEANTNLKRDRSIQDIRLSCLNFQATDSFFKESKGFSQPPTKRSRTFEKGSRVNGDDDNDPAQQRPISSSSESCFNNVVADNNHEIPIRSVNTQTLLNRPTLLPLLNDKNAMTRINGNSNLLVNSSAAPSNENHQNNNIITLKRISRFDIRNPNSRNHSDPWNKNLEVIDLTKDDDTDRDSSSLIHLRKEHDDTGESSADSMTFSSNFTFQVRQRINDSPTFSDYRDYYLYQKTLSLRKNSPCFNLDFIYIKNPFFDASLLPQIKDKDWHARDKKKQGYAIRGKTIWTLAMTDIIYHTLPLAFPKRIHAIFYDVMKPEIFEELWRANSHPGDFWVFNFAYYQEVGVDCLIYYLKCLLQPIADKMLILKEIGVVDRNLAVTRYCWN
ncbi:6319_t:CDS:2 [Ambispora gerdemannii]|uniref:6319_t:CDS:1 n=1 Tax=Ambispora gerdemannii TaxID=144530 RepID=A0A9N8YLX5_9GLOM|nr:6319_t:CDS:2 [Ambispora gerdemannii]